MPEKEFLIGRLKGQVEGWESQINKLKCDIDKTSKKGVKKVCRKKISELQSMILKAEEEISELSKKFKDRKDGTPAPPYLE